MSDTFSGYIYGRSGHVRYEISQFPGLHKHPHLWRVDPDGVTHHSVASFRSRADAEEFMEWFNKLIRNEP